MFLLEIDNNPTDTQNVKFSLVLKSAIELSESVQGSYLFNARIPATDKNNITFQHPQRLTKLDLSKKEFPSRISFNGRTFAEGSCIVATANSKYIEIAIALGSGEFNSLIKEKKLRETINEIVEIGTTKEEVIAHANLQVTKFYPDINHVFPTMWNDWFYGDPSDVEEVKNKDFEGYINQYFNDTFVMNDAHEVDPDNVSNLVPLLFNTYVFRNCFTHFGYKVAGKFLNDPELQQLIVYNNHAIDHVESRYSASTQLTDLGFSGSSTPLIIIFNENIKESDNSYDESTGKYTVQEIGWHLSRLKMDIKYQGDLTGPVHTTIRIMKEGIDIAIFEHNLLNNDFYPVLIQIKEYYAAADFGDKIFVDVHLENVGAPFDEPEFPDFTIRNASFTVTNVSQSNLNRYKTEIDYRDHVPDMEIATYLSAHYRAFSMVPFFDHRLKECELIFIKDILASVELVAFSENIEADKYLSKESQYEGLKFMFEFGDDDENQNDNEEPDSYTTVNTYGDLPDFPPLNTFYYVRNLNKYYQFISEEDPDTGYITLKYVPYMNRFSEQIIDEGKKEIKPEMSPVPMIYDPGEKLFVIMPNVTQVGTSRAFNLYQPTPNLRLMFWRGLRNYPLATPYLHDSVFVQVGDYELRWEGDNGLIKKFWQPAIDWYKRRLPVEFSKKMNETELEQLLFQKLHRTGDINILLQEISVSLEQDQIGTAKIKGWTH